MASHFGFTSNESKFFFEQFSFISVVIFSIIIIIIIIMTLAEVNSHPSRYDLVDNKPPFNCGACLCMTISLSIK